MIKIIKANQRHLADHGWLQSCFLFSFAEYYDPENLYFGSLRVFNDDHIAAHSGFPKHPHSNMEIVTLVLEGEISHEDSTGTKAKIEAGEVQRMTAGTGITHSEFNHAGDALHLFQLWFIPSAQNLPPSYEQKNLKFLDSKNELLPLVSGQKVLEDVLYMNTNTTIYWCNLETNKAVKFETFAIRKVFIYLTEGEITINGHLLRVNDQARIAETENMEIIATNDARFILIDLPAEPGT